MLKKLVEIGASKKGNRRKLGIFLGYDAKYASQRINEIYNKKSVNTSTFLKLLEAAELDHFLLTAIDAEYQKIKGN